MVAGRKRYGRASSVRGTALSAVPRQRYTLYAGVFLMPVFSLLVPCTFKNRPRFKRSRLLYPSLRPVLTSLHVLNCVGRRAERRLSGKDRRTTGPLPLSRGARSPSECPAARRRGLLRSRRSFAGAYLAQRRHGSLDVCLISHT